MQVCERFSWLLLFRFKCSFKNIKFTSGRSFIEGGRKTGVTGEKSLNLVFVICDPSWARTHCPSSYKLGKINQRKVRNRFRLSYVGPRYLNSLPGFYLLFMWSLIFIRKLLLGVRCSKTNVNSLFFIFYIIYFHAKRHPHRPTKYESILLNVKRHICMEPLSSWNSERW